MIPQPTSRGPSRHSDFSVINRSRRKTLNFLRFDVSTYLRVNLQSTLRIWLEKGREHVWRRQIMLIQFALPRLSEFVMRNLKFLQDGNQQSQTIYRDHWKNLRLQTMRSSDKQAGCLLFLTRYQVVWHEFPHFFFFFLWGSVVLEQTCFCQTWIISSWLLFPSPDSSRWRSGGEGLTALLSGRQSLQTQHPSLKKKKKVRKIQILSSHIENSSSVAAWMRFYFHQRFHHEKPSEAQPPPSSVSSVRSRIPPSSLWLWTKARQTCADTDVWYAAINAAASLKSEEHLDVCSFFHRGARSKHTSNYHKLW